MVDMRETLIKSIEREYGRYVSVQEVGDECFGSERDHIKRWLFSRFEQNRDVFIQVFEAIKENVPTRFGVPDLATVKKAVEQYQEDHGVRLYARPEMPRIVARVRSTEDEADSEGVRLHAEAAGIDTRVDGWFVRYLFLELERRRRDEGEKSA